MKKNNLILTILFSFFLCVAVFPLQASALGGYFVVKGLNGYHSALCENLSGYDIDRITWYETLKDVKRTGLSEAPCCKGTGYDYEDDDASMWNSSKKKVDNIFEIERMWGVKSGYEAGVSEGFDNGYSSGHSDGLNEGIASGYKDGYDAGYSDGKKISNPTELLLGIAGFWFFVVGFFLVLTQDKKEKDWENKKRTEELRLRNLQTDIDNEIAQKLEAEKSEILEWKKVVSNQIATEEKASLNRIRDKESEAKESIRLEKDAATQLSNEVNKIIKQTIQNNPELAKQIADAQYYLDIRSYNQLLYQKRPALKAAEEVKKISGEKRLLMKENRQLQYQLDFYEKLFPWLEDFKEVPSDEAVSYVTGAYGSEYDAVRKWISPEDFEKLSNAEKYQKILDRWKVRKKTDWDIGIEYERYIGYKLECDGYKVGYIGATLGLKDMGRDLIATKNGQTLIIQCKRWAKEKTIHEKHLFQLYGSTAVYATEHPDVHCKAVFITTAALSDTARKCAEYCNISVVENCPMGDYPLIKCNANKDGEKIYHLPFDQQYDKIVISKNKQSCYAWTTFEAEEKGFRRAYRWHPNKT